jgi:hypothetical protein
MLASDAEQFGLGLPVVDDDVGHLVHKCILRKQFNQD